MSEPRAYTPAEGRAMFLNHIRKTVDYWEALPNKTSLEKMDGLVWSIRSVR